MMQEKIEIESLAGSLLGFKNLGKGDPGYSVFLLLPHCYGQYKLFVLADCSGKGRHAEQLKGTIDHGVAYNYYFLGKSDRTDCEYVCLYDARKK